MIVKNQMYNRR